MSNENIEVQANVHIVVRDEHGNIKTEQNHNQTQTLGRDALADQMLTGASNTSGPTYAKISHVAIGTGTGQGVGATTLATEVARVGLNPTTKTRTANVVTCTAVQFAAGTPSGTNAITEAALLNASSAGTMWFYTSFAAITKGPSDTLDITWTLTF